MQKKKRKKIPHHREYFIGEEIQTRFPWEMPFKLNIDAFNRGFFFFFFFPPQFNANPFSSPLRKLDRTLGFFFFNLCLGKNRWKNSLAPSCFHVSTRIQPLLERFSIASVCPRYLYTATWQEIFQYHG